MANSGLDISYYAICCCQHVVALTIFLLIFCARDGYACILCIHQALMKATCMMLLVATAMPWHGLVILDAR